MDAKKISFGFSKTTKKQNLLQNKQPPVEENKVELIKCLEGHEIKLVEEKVETAPLVIPMKESQKTSGALLSLIKRREVLLGDDLPTNDCEMPDQDKEKDESNKSKTSIEIENGAPETLEQRAAKELLAETKSNGTAAVDSQLVLPIVKPDDLPLDGAKESTIDDYDSVPIQQFGLAMLRGMGWVEPPPKKVGPGVDDGPQVRPKGMGLGADKAVKRKPLLVPPEKNEVLEIKKQAYVRILGGKHKDLYGQIEGFDDFAGRVIVKMAIGGTKEAFNEFLCQPVSRNEYAQYGKCINTAKYEEYKKMENEHGQIIVKSEHKDERKESKQQIKREDNQSDKRNAQYERDYKSRERRGRHDDDTARYRQSTSSSTSRGVQRKSRSVERASYKSHASNKSENRVPSSGDSSISSKTDDSDADSAYGRKHKKSKSKRKSKKSKSKTRKHSKHRRHTPSSSSSGEVTDDSRSSYDKTDRRHKSHKKKTKKSKKQRERSRTRSRSRSHTRR